MEHARERRGGGEGEPAQRKSESLLLCSYDVDRARIWTTPELALVAAVVWMQVETGIWFLFWVCVRGGIDTFLQKGI